MVLTFIMVNYLGGGGTGAWGAGAVGGGIAAFVIGG